MDFTDSITFLFNEPLDLNNNSLEFKIWFQDKEDEKWQNDLNKVIEDDIIDQWQKQIQKNYEELNNIKIEELNNN